MSDEKHVWEQEQSELGPGIQVGANPLQKPSGCAFLQKNGSCIRIHTTDNDMMGGLAEVGIACERGTLNIACVGKHPTTGSDVKYKISLCSTWLSLYAVPFSKTALPTVNLFGLDGQPFLVKKFEGESTVEWS